MKKATISAALLGLLFVGCAANQPQAPSDRQGADGEADRFVWGTGITTEEGVQARVELNKRNFNLDKLPSPSSPQDPPTFRDVLRGKVGQECYVGSAWGTWTLVFSTADDGENSEHVAAGVPSSDDVMQAVHAHGLGDAFNKAYVEQQWVRTAKQFVEDLTEQAFNGNLTLVNPRDSMTVAAVGQDFIQLREADGTERFVPLSRVDVVVIPAGE